MSKDGAVVHILRRGTLQNVACHTNGAALNALLTRRSMAIWPCTEGSGWRRWKLYVGCAWVEFRCISLELTPPPDMSRPLILNPVLLDRSGQYFHLLFEIACKQRCLSQSLQGTRRKVGGLAELSLIIFLPCNRWMSRLSNQHMLITLFPCDVLGNPAKAPTCRFSARVRARDGNIDVFASPRSCGLLLIVTVTIRVSEITAVQLRSRIPHSIQDIPPPVKRNDQCFSRLG